jgi:hypothetical protein
MRWHFDMFEIDRGKKPTGFQRFLYRLVNNTVPLIFAWLVLLAVLAFFGGLAYIVVHFIVKYW